MSDITMGSLLGALTALEIEARSASGRRGEDRR